MAFHDVLFPTDISRHAHCQIERKVDIVTLANGYEERNARWAHSRRSYEASIGARKFHDLERIIAFFEARKGALHSFRWRDHGDFSSSQMGSVTSKDDQHLAICDGVVNRFQLVKAYGSGNERYFRKITKPVKGSVKIALADTELLHGPDFDVDYESGEVVLLTLPQKGAALSAGFLFDVEVRFQTSMINALYSHINAGEIPALSVVEVLS